MSDKSEEDITGTNVGAVKKGTDYSPSAPPFVQSNMSGYGSAMTMPSMESIHTADMMMPMGFATPSPYMKKDKSGCFKKFFGMRYSTGVYAACILFVLLVLSAVALGIFFVDGDSQIKSIINSNINSIGDTHSNVDSNANGLNSNINNNEKEPPKEKILAPVPGIRRAGLTIDALYGTNTERRAIAMDSYDEGKLFSDSVSNTVYSVPDSVQNVHRESSCAADISVSEYKNIEEYTKAFTLGLNIGYGAFTLGPELTWSTSRMTESNGRLYEAKLNCVSYNTALHIEHPVLTDDFIHAVKNTLPSDESDFDGFVEFFNTWGTHFYDTVQLGGLMQSNVIFSETFVLNKKSFSVQAAAKAILGGPTVAANFGYTDSDVNEARENEKGTKQFHRGGNPEVFFTSGFEAWVGTIDENPDVIDYTLAPLSSVVMSIDKVKGVAMEKAVKRYLNYVGNIKNPGRTCEHIKDSFEEEGYNSFNEGVYFVTGIYGEPTATLCNFDVGGGGWTLIVNKLGGWSGDFLSTNAWSHSTSINNLRPTLVADYKKDFIDTIGTVTEFLLQNNANKRKGSRIYGKFKKGSHWEMGPKRENGNFGIRRLLDEHFTRYLILSEAGGMCVNEGVYDGGFNCDGNDDQGRGNGLFDPNFHDEFKNCDSFGWKDATGGLGTMDFLGSCGAINSYTSQDCGDGDVIYPNCCTTHFAHGSHPCGFLTFGCKCECRRSRNHVTYCGDDVGYVSLWFR